jgi:acetylornithine deacetylase/succinyl-diaminopimelate desuccinylase-like protein
VEVGSVGLLEHEPNTVGVVAAHARLTADLRSLDDAAVERGLNRLEETSEEISIRREVGIETVVAAREHAVRFPTWVVGIVEEAARTIGEEPMRLASGANHDASNLARVCPAGMVFVPSRDGRSHSPQEYTAPHACERGAAVLALAAADLADEGRSVHE